LEQQGPKKIRKEEKKASVQNVAQNWDLNLNFVHNVERLENNNCIFLIFYLFIVIEFLAKISRI
jgi:type IV secretory pathway component VirB8